MLKQVDFAELIAYMAKQAPTDNIVIEISKVRELGHELEQKSSMIVFDGDKYSIESFMKKLCSIDSIVRLDTVIGYYKLYNPSDDDFIALMKQDETNELFKEWISRQYKYIPVWKSPEEFADFFGVKRGESIRNAAFEDTVKAKLSEMGIINRDLIILKVTFKPKVKLSSLYIYIHNKVRRFTDIYKDENGILTAQEFYYLYINRDCVKDEKIEEFRLKIVNQLGKVMKHLYPIGDV